MDQIFFQNPKNLIFGPFLGTPNPTGDFFKNWAASLYLFYDYLISCKNLEKIDQPIAKSSTANGQRANGRTDGRREQMLQEISASAGAQKLSD